MQYIRYIKNMKLITLIVFSLFLTGAFSIFASYAESAPTTQVTQTQSNVAGVYKSRFGAESLRLTSSAKLDSSGLVLPEYVEGEVLVVIEAPATSAFSAMGALSENNYSQALTSQAEAFASEFGLEAVNTFSEIAGISGKSIIHLRSENKSAEELVQELSSAHDVVSVSPNYIIKLDDPPTAQISTNYRASDNEWIPDDPYYPQLWGMENIGMPQVWDYITGSDAVVVAVMDSGIDYNHPDLESNMARDSYGNYGKRFQNGMQGNDPLDTYGHGTHVAGTIGAEGNNGVGVAGVNWEVKMLAVNVLPNGSGAWSDVIAGMEYVVSEKNKGLNIRVANMSFGGAGEYQADDSPLGAALKSMSDAGIICTISAGNDGQNLNNSSNRNYPACFKFSNTITVGASDGNNARSVWSSSGSSNYGNGWVDIAAPGSDIYSTIPGNGYESWGGTSMAAPHAAGAAALLCAAYPNESASQIKARMLSKARNIGVSEGLWANGILDVWGAYGTPEITTTLLYGSIVGLSYSQTLKAYGIAPITWTIEIGGLPNGLNLNSATGEIYGTPSSVGEFHFTVKATNSAGSDMRALNIVVTVTPIAPTIIPVSLPEGAIGFPYSQTLNASATAPITWTIEVGNLPNGLNLNGATGEIYGTPSSTGLFNFTVRASNTAGSATRALSINIPAPISVTGVSLNKNSASLHVAQNEYLTATVFPADASNKKVMWSSNNPTVAAVNDYGFVTVISAGSATITVTTVDGGFIDTCNIAVSSHLFQSGSGTLTDPFIITTATELNAVNNILTAHYKLGANIDLTTWLTIGNVRSDPFTGSFDGDGYMICGLRTSLFGYTFGLSDSVIKNLGVEIDAAGSSSSGLVSFSQINIENCYVIGGDINSWGQVGGLVGWQEWGVIKNCYATVNVSGGQNVAGLVGVQRGSIESSYATGNVNASHYISLAGGLVGSCEGNISNSYATGNVTGNGTSVGGLTGQSGAISNSYATGNVIGTERVGGLTGGSSGLVSNNYAAGNVIGNYNVGALMGVTLFSTSTGSVGSITNNYRYEFASLNNAVIPASDPDSAHDKKHGGVKTALELMTQSTYSGNGWLFAPSGPWHWDSGNFPKLNIGAENFTFDFAPTITRHPQNRTVAAGNIASFSASAIGNTPLVYQWQRSNNSGASWSNVGTNADTYFFTAQTSDNGAQFRVMVSNSLGSTTSNVMILTVGTSLPVGNGSAGDPYIITTPAQLDEAHNYLDAYYRLGNDIDLSAYLASGGAGYIKWGSAGWMPIGTEGVPFTGNFNGDGYKISGLWIYRSDTEYIGLFGRIFNAEISKLGVEITAGIEGDVYVGGLVGYSANSSVENCYATGNVNGSRIVGGLVGSQSMESSVISSYATGSISASNISDDYRSHVGGLVGSSEGAISNCYATGIVYAKGTAVGGLAGESNSISNSYSTCDVSGGDWVGGLVGGAFGAVSNSYATGNVSSGGDNVNGLMGVVLRHLSIGSVGSITSSYRYQFATVNGAVLSENTPNGMHGGIRSAAELMTKVTYTSNGWLFNDSAPTVGPWHWDSRGFPKLNIGTENFPFGFEPGVPVISIISQPAPNTTVTQGSISGNLSVLARVTQGATLSYQWYRNTTNSNAGGSIETGATSSNFTIPTNLTAAGSPYYFYCVVSAGGAVSVHSNVATVTVNIGSIDPTGVTLNVNFISIAKGGSEQLIETVLPVNATNKNVTWHTNDATVATVSNGLVTGVAQGKATITVTTVVGGFTDTCDLMVTDDEPNNPPGISGPVYMELNSGYEATASNIFSITGTEPVSVTKTSGNASITWDDANKKLNIAAGLTPGSYTVVLTASNGIAPNATHTFTLTVINIPPGSARLYFVPENITAGKDRTFTITFNVDSPELYNQVECVLAYDPELLELEAVTQIPPPTDWMMFNYSEWGKATFSLAPMFGNSTLLSGDTSIATLRFKALQETSGTDISIIQLFGNGAGSSKLQHQVGGMPVDIPFATQGSTVTIVDGVATLKASFQWRNVPSAANIEDLMVKWISGNVVIAEEIVTADQNGEAEIIIPSQNSGLTIWVKGERTLAASQYIGTVENASVINIGTLLGGDGNGDNIVDLNDFNVFLMNYGKNATSPGFNRLADFNNDGVVDLNDFNVFLNNYGKTGAQLPAGHSSSAMTMMSLNAESEEISVNEADSNSGCNVGMISLALLMLSAAPLFRKNK